MKHTPGEWHVDGFNLTAVISKVEEYHYQHICNCNFGYEVPEKYLELNKANAKLIAAAPELLQIANRVAYMLGSYLLGSMGRELAEEAKAAIKKATV